MESLIHMGKMGWPSSTIDDNIIKENEDKMTEKRMEDMIHEALEGGGGITQDKGHDQELIVTLMSLKDSLGDVFLFHMDLVVVRMEIKFKEVLRTT
jgi:hypothetical protein